jgi:hypothetical protein
LAIDEEYWTGRFETVIHGRDRCPRGLFFGIVAGNIPKEIFSEPKMSEVMGGRMARTGLYFCEKHATPDYHEFLCCVGYWLRQEYSAVVGLDVQVATRTLRRQSIDRVFLKIAEDIYFDDLVACPRAVAWGLIEDGLKLCHCFERERYPSLVASLYFHVFENELPRTKDWPCDYVPD